MSFKFQFKVEDLISEGRVNRENFEVIKQWVKDERFVPKDLPDEMIVLFLISCEHNVNMTKNTIMSYFKLKKNAPELHDNRIVNSKEMDLMMEVWTIANFPKRTKENFVIHYFRLEDEDYKKFDTAAMLKATLMLIDISLDKKNPPDGLIVICDMSLGSGAACGCRKSNSYCSILFTVQRK
ncbi:unnamed protein product [Psylliodes chrysocephalus]|uniref:Uncharacterized protein n=1 Tax=Psylliodes chrysocephalus TaxID=3402493 RepID=A0A9P0D3X1_9CUCU|nr:unnamed protein product [Psylliodes chrysocephala]